MLKLSAVILALTLSTPAFAQQSSDSVSPEPASQDVESVFKDGKWLNSENVELVAEEGQVATSKNWMVSAANPLASEAGAAVLRAGGNAVDAMVAVQLTLGLVEPQSSGLGGGAFLVYWDAKEQRLTTFDGREKAPMAATPRLFQDDKGEPLKFYDAVVGGRSVGVPGTPMLLASVHGQYGSLPWSTLFDAPIGLAENGFSVSPRLSSLIEADKERLSRFEGTRSYFFNEDGSGLQAGDTLTNAAYANTLRAISEQGAKGFYEGPIAEEIINAIQTAEGNPGIMNLKDLAGYHIKERAPVCYNYRGYDVCGMGPPSSGALTVGQILGVLEPYDMRGLGAGNVQSWRLIGDASRLAFADRGRYMADSDYVPVPSKGLIDENYLADRSSLLRGGLLETVSPGTPEFDHALLQADDESIELPSTSHFSIRDAEGNIVSMTTTIENGFGSRVMAAGFLLNNELTDFSFRSHRDGVPIANRVEPGKRPRSSMSPTIILKGGEPYMAIGSPGGSRIIGYVANAIIAHIDWDMNIQTAINMPHLVNRFGTYDLEKGTSAELFSTQLEELGYKVNVRDLTSGIHAIQITKDQLIGGADPRREGLVIGE